MEEKEKRRSGLDRLRLAREVLGVILTVLLSLKAAFEIILLSK